MKGFSDPSGGVHRTWLKKKKNPGSSHDDWIEVPPILYTFHVVYKVSIEVTCHLEESLGFILVFC